MEKQKTDIITFPLKFLRGYRDEIKEAADKKHLSINKYILEAIEEKMQSETVNK